MKTKHHEIEIQGLQEWLSNEEITYSNSTRERKKLVCTLNGTFKVYVSGSLKWQGTQPFSAVEAYNAIEDKYI
jgi:hypothetical protein